MLTYQTAWLKVHYPLYFYTSVLTNESNSNAKDATEKVKTAIAEAKKRGIKFLQPDINKSEGGFSVEDGAIRFGLVAIKGVGYKAMDAIQEARRYKEFTSMADFLERVDVRVCNKRVINCLVLAGAFDSLNSNRLEVLAEYYDIRGEEFPEMIKIDRSNTISLNANRSYRIMDLLDWEQALLGMFVSYNPLEDFDLPSWSDVPIKQQVDTVGILFHVKEIVTRKGDPMAFATIETLEGPLELVIFPKTFEDVQKKLIKGKIVRVTGRKDDQAKIILNTLTHPRLKAVNEIITRK